MNEQNEYDFISDDGTIAPSAQDTLMFIGYCLKAYEITNGEPLAVDNELVKELIAASVDEETIPAILVGMKGQATILQGEMRSIDGD